jgi:hypothetical protein
VNDATGHDALSFYLAYVHPVWMLATIALALITLRAGLELRGARRRGQRRSAASYRAHLKLAKPTLLLLGVGFLAGVASSVGLRGWSAFASAHGLVALSALGLFAATGILGHRLERGISRSPDLHGILALLSILAATAAFGTGFILLP